MKKFSACILALFLLGMALSGCSAPSGSNPVPPSQDETAGGNPSDTQPEEIPCPYQTDGVVIPVSGFQDVTDAEGKIAHAMTPDYSDSYTFSCSKASQIDVYSASGSKVASGSDKVTASLEKGQNYVVGVTADAQKTVKVTAKAKNHVIRLPYDLPELEDAGKYSLTCNRDTDPLVPAKVDYKKRQGGTYIYSNNPELIPNDSIGDAFIRNENLQGEVYFTFEHANYTSKNLYLGYQLLNEGNEDVYVTVTNIGYQAGGTWFGQDAWYKFYNTRFQLPKDYYTDGKVSSKYASFEYAYSNLVPREFQPYTYRIPAGEYFYVIGGTTEDAFAKINVDNSADRLLKPNMCANGNVKFIVTGGKVTGTFYAYSDISQVKKNPKARGYRADRFGAQYMGIADHAGVIDNFMSWTFSDKTKDGALPVTYTNRYDAKVPQKTTPYKEYNNQDYTVKSAADWMTHLNPQNNHRAVGMDLVEFVCVDEAGNRVVIDNYHADGSGNPANTANWMIEYQDHFTLVNQGDGDRVITFRMKDHGTLALLVRDKTGAVLQADYTLGLAEGEWSWSYQVVVPAHSVEQITLDYLLVACSYGTVIHSAELGKNG